MEWSTSQVMSFLSLEVCKQRENGYEGKAVQNPLQQW